MGKKSLYLKIFGEVQGVNYRYWTHEAAKHLGLVGWVRNNPDGTVECEVEGEEDLLKEFLKWAKNGPKLARVEKVEARWKEFKDEFDGFEIRF